MSEVTLTCQRCGTKSTATGDTSVLLGLGWQEVGPLHGECEDCDHTLFFCPKCAPLALDLTQAMKLLTPIPLSLLETERQGIVLALAHLSIERPGGDDMLNRLALRIDNDAGGRAKLYDEFRA